jgi:hypothetical protein
MEIKVNQLASALEFLQKEGLSPVYTDAHISATLDELAKYVIPDQNVNSMEVHELGFRTVGTLRRRYALRFLNDSPDLVSFLHVNIFGVEARSMTVDPASLLMPYDHEVRSALVTRLQGKLDDVRGAVLDNEPSGVYVWYSINLPQPTSIKTLIGLGRECGGSPYGFGRLVVTVALGPAPASLLRSLGAREDALTFFLCKFTSSRGEVEMTWSKKEGELKIEKGEMIRERLTRAFNQM